MHRRRGPTQRRALRQGDPPGHDHVARRTANRDRRGRGRVERLVALKATALQLLPNRDYGPDGNSPSTGRWLEVHGLDGNLEQALPSQDPYEEIYEKRTGLLKLVTDRYLRPGASGSDLDDMWLKYLDHLSDTRDFHDALRLQKLLHLS